MSQLSTKCDKCDTVFDPKENLASAGAITIAAATVGAAGGAKVGIGLGPHGAIAGTVPGAVVGMMGGHIIDNTWVTCPDCNNTKQI